MTRSLECESTTVRNDKFLELSTKHNIIFVKKFTHANNNFEKTWHLCYNNCGKFEKYKKGEIL